MFHRCSVPVLHVTVFTENYVYFRRIAEGINFVGLSSVPILASVTARESESVDRVDDRLEDTWLRLSDVDHVNVQVSTRTSAVCSPQESFHPSSWCTFTGIGVIENPCRKLVYSSHESLCFFFFGFFFGSGSSEKARWYNPAFRASRHVCSGPGIGLEGNKKRS